MQKISIKREQSQAGLSFAEREKFRPQVKNKLLLLLALLMTAATGAWAAETPLLTIESKDYTTFKSGSKTFDDKVTVTFSNSVSNAGNNNGWYATNPASLLTVAGTNGYTITSCKFYTQNGTASTGYTVEGESPSVYLYNAKVYTDANQSENIGFYGITKIEVYGAAAPAGFTVSLKDGVKDADKWTISPNPAEEGQTVTLQYTGRLKVKGVKATSVPDGALSGVFSVSDTKQVYFSKGNLQLVGENTLQFAENQWDYFGINQSDNHRDLLCWGTGNNPNQTTGNSTFTDWGDNTYLQATLGKGWRTMTKDEFVYVFNTRASGSSVFGIANGRYTAATINTDGTGVKGIILFPDGITIEASEVTTAGTINSTSTMTQCTTAQWAALAGKGCVFLPAAGFILSGTGIGHGDISDYWTSTAADASKAYNLGLNLGFSGAVLNPAGTLAYNYGLSVRLVREVATTDAESAKPAATVTTAPTGAAIVGVGKTTELVSGGVADGGTLRYAVTTTNTMPTSTAGFSDAVPTAKDITASGKVYVWYYVKADDTHSDSEIAATAIEVPVADIIWDVTNVSDLQVMGTYAPYEKEGVTLSGNGDNLAVLWYDFGNPKTDGIGFEIYDTGSFTFTAPTGKAFTKIEMRANMIGGWYNANLGTGWACNWDPDTNIATVTWTGSAASTVELLTGADEFEGATVKSIAFYLSE